MHPEKFIEFSRDNNFEKQPVILISMMEYNVIETYCGLLTLCLYKIIIWL